MRNRKLDGESDSHVNASQSSSTNLRRRGFLLALSAGSAGVAAAAASAMPGAAIATASAPTAPAVEDAGYRETQHIRDYYRTAKI